MSTEFEEFKNRVKKKADIVKVIKQYIELDQNNKAKCPFHDEKIPSFSVNEEGQYFYCFGCGKWFRDDRCLRRHRKTKCCLEKGGIER